MCGLWAPGRGGREDLYILLRVVGMLESSINVLFLTYLRMVESLLPPSVRVCDTDVHGLG